MSFYFCVFFLCFCFLLKKLFSFFLSLSCSFSLFLFYFASLVFAIFLCKFLSSPFFRTPKNKKVRKVQTVEQMMFRNTSPQSHIPHRNLSYLIRSYDLLATTCYSFLFFSSFPVQCLSSFSKIINSFLLFTPLMCSYLFLCFALVCFSLFFFVFFFFSSCLFVVSFPCFLFTLLFSVVVFLFSEFFPLFQSLHLFSSLLYNIFCLCDFCLCSFPPC